MILKFVIFIFLIQGFEIGFEFQGGIFPFYQILGGLTIIPRLNYFNIFAILQSTYSY